MKNKWLRQFIVATALLIGSSTTFSAAELGAKDEPIKLSMVEWTGAHISTHIAGQLLEKLGYKVEYVTAGTFPQFSGLADGSLSASVEVWMNNVGDIFPKGPGREEDRKHRFSEPRCHGGLGISKVHGGGLPRLA